MADGAEGQIHRIHDLDNILRETLELVNAMFTKPMTNRMVAEKIRLNGQQLHGMEDYDQNATINLVGPNQERLVAGNEYMSHSGEDSIPNDFKPALLKMPVFKQEEVVLFNDKATELAALVMQHWPTHKDYLPFKAYMAGLMTKASSKVFDAKQTGDSLFTAELDSDDDDDDDDDAAAAMTKEQFDGDVPMDSEPAKKKSKKSSSKKKAVPSKKKGTKHSTKNFIKWTQSNRDDFVEWDKAMLNGSDHTGPDSDKLA